MDAILWHPQPYSLSNAKGWPPAENRDLIVFNLDGKPGQTSFKSYSGYPPLKGLLKNHRFILICREYFNIFGTNGEQLLFLITSI